MFTIENVSGVLLNLSLYVIGLGLAVAGALGLAEAIELSVLVSGVVFILGLAFVIAVHEFFGGPI